MPNVSLSGGRRPAEAAWLPLVTSINVVFLSRRAGNYGYQPATGGSLWDRMTVR